MDHTFRYQNHKINYYSEGNGEPFLFLHGWPTNSKLWKFQVDRLKSDYRIITLDWLGFGKSDKPLDFKYTFTRKKEILDILLNEILKENEKINIIAHDIGGPPAILWASAHQDRVKRLILLNTVLYPFSTPLDKISHTFFRIPIIKNIISSNFGLRILMKYWNGMKIYPPN